MKEYVDLGRFTPLEIDSLLHQADQLADAGEKIDFISEHFLGIPYKRSPLIGGPDSPEVFVVDLSAVDCLTLLEYVEAMRRSRSFSEFRDNLRKVRYASGTVDYFSRRHFFSDWIATESGCVRDATRLVGGTRSRLVQKYLNLKPSGEPYVPGIPCRTRSFHYLPGDSIDGLELASLHTGDYIGIYAEEQGLDVTHTGIVIIKGDRCLLRHASSAPSGMKVVDEDFPQHIREKPGILIVRAL